MNQMLMLIMAAGAVAGGIDRIFGNKRGYGAKFEEGFQFLGSTALSMAGMICLAPVLADILGKAIIPFYQKIGVDPGMFGSILAIDMGGYQLSRELAQDPLIGSYAGIVAASIFGCTVVFTIPVGMGMIREEDRGFFAKGVMLGSLPVTEFLQRVLKKPFYLLGKYVGVNAAGMTGLLVGAVSAIPAISMYRDMDERGKVVNAAFLVSAASMLAAHMGFALSAEPELLGTMVGAKVSGGVAAVLLALFVCSRSRGRESSED